MSAQKKPYGCNDFDVASGNSDANCYRKRISFASRAVYKNPSLCDTCVYRKPETQEEIFHDAVCKCTDGQYMEFYFDEFKKHFKIERIVTP